MGKIIIRKENNHFSFFDYNTHKLLNSDFNYNISAFSNENNNKNFNSMKVGQKDVLDLDVCSINNIIRKSVENTDYIIDFPLAIGIMVTNMCNMNCDYCLTRKVNNSTVFIPKEIKEYTENIKELNPLCFWVTGGEPLLWPSTLTLIEELSSSHSYIALDTNGLLLDEKIVNNKKVINTLIEGQITVRVSLDGHTPEINDHFRSDYAIIVKNIEKLINLGIEVRVNTVVTSANIMYLKELANFLVSLGVNGWNIFQLQEGFAPTATKIPYELYECKIKELIEYATHFINLSVIYGNIPFSSVIIDPIGNIFTSDTANGEKIVLSNIYEKDYVTLLKSNYTPYFKNHINKYINTGF